MWTLPPLRVLNLLSARFSPLLQPAPRYLLCFDTTTSRDTEPESAQNARTREKRITYCSKTAALNMHVAFRQSEKCNTDSCAPGEDEGAVQIVVPRHLHPTDPEPAVQYGAL